MTKKDGISCPLPPWCVGPVFVRLLYTASFQNFKLYPFSGKQLGKHAKAMDGRQAADARQA